MTLRTRYADIAAYLTKDGSIIRELMHPASHGCQSQSLAEATVPVGTATTLHRHAATEELYHFKSGTGLMTLGNETFAVGPGDTICIRPGTPHRLQNTGDGPLVLLCCCAPAYSHEDTELLA